jgi:hypothetical protein
VAPATTGCRWISPSSESIRRRFWTTCVSSCASTCDGCSDRPEPSQTWEPWVNACACILSLSRTASGPVCTRTSPRPRPKRGSKNARVVPGSGCPAEPPERIRDSVSELSSEPWVGIPAEPACRCTPPEQSAPLAQPEQHSPRGEPDASPAGLRITLPAISSASCSYTSPGWSTLSLGRKSAVASSYASRPGSWWASCELIAAWGCALIGRSLSCAIACIPSSVRRPRSPVRHGTGQVGTALPTKFPATGLILINESLVPGGRLVAATVQFPRSVCFDTANNCWTGAVSLGYPPPDGKTPRPAQGDRPD